MNITDFKTTDLMKTATLFICFLFLNMSIVFFILESGSFLPLPLSYFLAIVIAFTISKTLQDDILQSTNFYLASDQEQTSILLKKSDVFYIAIAAAGAVIFFLKIVRVRFALPYENWRGEVEVLISLISGGITSFFLYFIECRTIYCAVVANKKSVASVVASEDILIYNKESATDAADTDIDLLEITERAEVETAETVETVEDEKPDNSLNETQKKILKIIEEQRENGDVNKAAIAREMGINRSTVYRNLKIMGIELNGTAE